jgi:hypothetical protein
MGNYHSEVRPLRRAAAKFAGLLREGRNRKKAASEIASHLRKLWGPSDLAGDLTLTIRRLIAPLTLAIAAAFAGQADAQGAFPAPLPGQTVQPNDPAFPPVNGAAPTVSLGAPSAAPSAFPSGGAAPITGSQFERPPAPQSAGAQDSCMKGFVPLREEAEKRGKLIKAASDRHAPPAEACKLIQNFGQAELKMIKYVETNSAKCGIPSQIAEQLKGGHKNTEVMQKKVCDVAQQAQTRGPAGPSLSEVLGSSAALPEATPTTKKGGSTFDTLNGNVLTR